MHIRLWTSHIYKCPFDYKKITWTALMKIIHKSFDSCYEAEWSKSTFGREFRLKKAYQCQENHRLRCPQTEWMNLYPPLFVGAFPLCSGDCPVDLEPGLAFIERDHRHAPVFFLLRSFSTDAALLLFSLSFGRPTRGKLMVKGRGRESMLVVFQG